jgi:hypothetical protein
MLLPVMGGTHSIEWQRSCGACLMTILRRGRGCRLLRRRLLLLRAYQASSRL